jgi:uncharacterized protein
MSEFNVVNNADEKRFEVQLDDDNIAMIQYMRAGNNIIFTHTEVPEAYGGQGIASKMAHVALEYAKENGLRVQALCPFVKKYVIEHPEYQSITWGFGDR